MKLLHLLRCSRHSFARSCALLLLSAILFMPVKGICQNSYSVRIDKGSLENAIEQVRKVTGAVIAYNPKDIASLQVRATDYRQVTVEQLLNRLISGLPLRLQRNGSTWVLLAKETLSPKNPGKINGTIVDQQTGDPLASVTIRIGNITATSSVDGSFSILLSAGRYEAIISSVGYSKKVVTDIEVREDAVFPLDVTLQRQKEHLSAVVVTASASKESTTSLYARQKNNAAITDGISQEQISRTPDKNIGEVLKRITGLATMDNKYVVVRGLGERYNQAVLNGQIMPSTELNRKNFSYDIIPSNIVENVTVVKTITPDRSAEFGGGLVEVNTMDIPTSNFLNISVGTSYNDKITGKDFLSLQLEGKEYMGKVSEHRSLMGTLDWTNESDVRNKFNEVANKDPNAFSNNWGLYKLNAPLSQSHQLSIGRVIPAKGGQQFGVVASVSYRNTFARQDARMSRDGFQPLLNEPTTDFAAFKGQRYGFTTNLGGLLGIGFRNERHRLSYQTLYLLSLDQQLITGAGNHDTQGRGAFGYYDLTTQTNLWQNQLKGEHALGKRGIKFKWMGSYLRLDRKKPDNHQNTTPYATTDSSAFDEYSIQSTYSSGINSGALRWWSRALENNYTWDASLAVPFQFQAGRVPIGNTFKLGYGGWSKERSFYVVNIGTGFNNHGGYPQPLAHAFSPINNVNFTYSTFSDNFHRTATLHAMYGMMDNKIGDRLRLVWGVRAEYYNLNSVNATLDSLFAWINQSRGGSGIEKWDYSELLNREPDWNIFPSANLTYHLTKNMNLRLGYAKSIIRPDLRELSFFREYDFELGGVYQSELVRSTIAHHLDFRYEWYPGPGEIMSFSLFHKKFDYPMEIYTDEGSGSIFELKNNKSAKNYGLEVEIRKSLGFTKVPVLRNITLYGNFTAMDARVTAMDVNFNGTDTANPTKVTPIELIGKEEKRPQSGASNYMVNAGFYYDIQPLSFSLVYNYVSNRMFRPDRAYRYSLFEQPQQSLDAQLAGRFLKQRLEVRLNVANLLNSYSLVYLNRYDNDPDVQNGLKAPSTSQLSYQKSEDVINYEARPGRTFSATISYRF